MTSESTPLFQQGHLEQSDQAHVQVAFGNLQGRDSAILWTIHTSASSSTQYRSASSIHRSSCATVCANAWHRALFQRA